MKTARIHDRQSGFTLVELMIAIVLALVLLAGVLNIMVSNRASLKTQTALAGLQAQARLLNLVIDNAFAHAGYKKDPTADNDDIFTANSGTPSMRAGAFIAASSTANKARLRVRFKAAGGLFNCLGNEIGKVTDPDSTTLDPTSNMSTVTADFALEYDANENSLGCHVYKKNKTPPLVNNVRVFKTRFALDTDGDNSVDQYVNTLSEPQQKQVLAVRIQALLQTKPRKLSSSLDRTFTFMDGTTIQVNDSRRGFLLFDRTVALKNALKNTMP